jgi:hypothetical protein
VRSCLFFILAGLCLTGCRSTPPQADPDRAREALTAMLDGWQRGEGEVRLAGQSVAVRDRDRAAGYKLLKYQLGQPEPGSFAFRCPVTLELSGPGGKRLTRQAVYNVTTHPSLLVARVDDD